MLHSAVEMTAMALELVCSRLRSIHPEMTVFQLQVFCVVAAMHPKGISQREALTRIGTSEPSHMSRTAAHFSDLGSRGMEPLHLIELYPNPLDRRERLMRLSPLGVAVWRDFGLYLRRT